jgi:hypothetical protein
VDAYFVWDLAHGLDCIHNGVLQTDREVCAINEAVEGDNVVIEDGSAEELDVDEVVATADNSKALHELEHLDLAVELALKNDDIFALKSAAPGVSGGGGGVGVGSSEEVVGGRAELEVIVDVGFLGERVAKAGEGGAARDRGGVG